MRAVDVSATRREFVLRAGAFGFALGASGIDLAPANDFKGKITGSNGAAGGMTGAA